MCRTTSTENVDHGKTLLLDSIRDTRVQAGEAGGMTQHVGASFIPIETIKKICGPMLERMKIGLAIPGLLFIDTPGHEAFTTLRKRGGAVADLAILVIDINSGFQPQTDESLTFLREFKTPFVVAATKVDRIAGWRPDKNKSFLETFEEQRNDVKEELEKKVYNLVGQLSERGFDADRFDRFEKIGDFAKRIAVVPCSGLTGEGVPDLLMVLTGLAQQFLEKRLTLSDIGHGTVLEVKDLRGFGTTIDAIIYDGSVHKSDYLVIGGKEPTVTKIKALLRPRPLKELRVEKQFDTVDEVHAAAGIKIAATGLDSVIAGSPIIFAKEKDIEPAKAEVRKEVEEVVFEKDVEGVIVKADTLGSLEAMIKMLGSEEIRIRKAEAGNVNRQDVIEAQNVKDDLRKVILAFNVHPIAEAESLARDLNIKIFQNNIIYRLIEEYKEWCAQSREREMEEKLSKVARPAKIKLLKGYVFHVAKPCIVGVEVLAGYLKSGARLKNEEGKIIGKVKEVQKEGKNIGEAKAGDKVAISMNEPIMGRQIKEGEVLVTYLTADDKKILKEVFEKLSDSEKELLKEI